MADHVLLNLDLRRVVLEYQPEAPPGYVYTNTWGTDSLDADQLALWLGLSVTF